MNHVYSDAVSERGKGNLNEMTPGTYYLKDIISNLVFASIDGMPSDITNKLLLIPHDI